MGFPNLEVGYTVAMPWTEDHEVHKDMWWHWTKKKNITHYVILPAESAGSTSLRANLATGQKSD